MMRGHISSGTVFNRSRECSTQYAIQGRLLSKLTYPLLSLSSPPSKYLVCFSRSSRTSYPASVTSPTPLRLES